MLSDLLLILLSLGLLFGGAEGLVRGSASIALRAGLPPLVIGLTVVAFGTSTPELVVSLEAAWAGQGDIAVGNVVGSNIFNIGVILGLTALICPIPVRSQLVKGDVPIMIGVAVVAWLLLGDGYLGRLEGLILFAGIVVYTATTVSVARRKPDVLVDAEFAEGLPHLSRSWWLDLALVLGGLGVLVLGSRLLVDNAVSLARALGMSEATIGLTIIAAGTSMPELATSLVAALRREPDIAVGNVVGSNIFNILGILGVVSLAVPIHAPGLHRLDFVMMIAISIGLLPLLWSGLVLRRLEGALLLAVYGVYLSHLWPK